MTVMMADAPRSYAVVQVAMADGIGHIPGAAFILLAVEDAPVVDLSFGPLCDDRHSLTASTGYLPEAVSQQA